MSRRSLNSPISPLSESTAIDMIIDVWVAQQSMKKLNEVISETINKQPIIMNDRERIGKRIAELRQEKGLSQVELADKAELDKGHIARIELGRYNVGIDTLSRIGEALGVSVDFITK